MGIKDGNGLFNLRYTEMDQEEEISNKIKALYKNALRDGKDVLCVYYY